MNFKALAIAGLGTGAVLLVPANSASAATFTGSFTGNFDDFNFGGIVDSGTISYTLEANDLNGDNFLFLGDDFFELEFGSLLLESSGFSTPEYNFSLFINSPINDGNDTALPLGIAFDFDSEILAAILLNTATGGIAYDEIGIFSVSAPFYGIEVDLDGDGPGEFISAPSAIPEPVTLLGTLTALGLGAVAKRKHSATSKQA